MRQVHTLVKDLLAPNPWIYYLDLVVSLAIGHTAFFFFSRATFGSAQQILSFATAAFAFYRVTVFTHEIAHFANRRLHGFKWFWNALVGVPFLVPSFLYAEHRIHHLKHTYGTPSDSEYLPLGLGTGLDVLRYFAQTLLVPVLGLLRFVVLAPISWLVPALRRPLWERSTAIVAINWHYRRAISDDPAERREAQWLEIACFLYGSTFLTLIAVGVLPWQVLPQFYAVFLFVSVINYLRTLAAHRYLSDGRESSYLEQLLDSYTIPGHPLATELWAPMGMRYHALHHLVPSLPYHNMGRAHRRLMRELPAGSPYRRTIRSGLWTTVAEVLRSIRSNPPHSAAASMS